MVQGREAIADSPSRSRRITVLWRGSLCLAVVCLSLLAPLLLPVALWHMAPTLLETWYAAYTGLDHSYFRVASELQRPLTPEMRAFVRRLYLERTAVETIVRTYNVLSDGISLAALALALAFGIHVLSRRFNLEKRFSLLTQVLALALLFFPVSLLWKSPLPLLLTAGISLIFVLNFALAPQLDSLCQYPGGRCVVGLFVLFTGYVSYILAPVAVLLFWTRSLWPRSTQAGHLARLAGRAITGVVAFPVMTIAFLSLRPEPLSSQALQVLAAKELYDVEIDPVANRAIVTSKKGEKGYAVDLDLQIPPMEFEVPSVEIEDVALDVSGRRIFHVDRRTRDILIINADSFAVKKAGTIPIPCSGSTKLALVRPANRLFVSWENDYFVVVNLETFQTEAVARTGNVNPLGDDSNAVVYVSHGSSPTIEAIDAKTLRVAARAPAPRIGERLALSAKRKELYAPDALGSRVWVYSTPELNLTWKIPTQFGVRALAVDEERQWLLAGSAITGYVEIIDLSRRETIQRHFVGKYCRIIGVDTSRRQAFITVTKEGLFLLKY